MGGSCVGKTTFSRRLAGLLGVPHVSWTRSITIPVGRRRPPTCPGARPRDPRRDSDGWVADGNYRSKLGALVLERADTAVLLEPPFPLAFGRALRRTIGRTITREELWNGNREQIRHLVTPNWIPWWVFRTHRRYARQNLQRVAEHPHLSSSP